MYVLHRQQGRSMRRLKSLLDYTCTTWNKVAAAYRCHPNWQSSRGLQANWDHCPLPHQISIFVLFCFVLFCFVLFCFIFFAHARAGGGSGLVWSGLVWSGLVWSGPNYIEKGPHVHAETIKIGFYTSICWYHCRNRLSYIKKVWCYMYTAGVLSRMDCPFHAVIQSLRTNLVSKLANFFYRVNISWRIFSFRLSRNHGAGYFQKRRKKIL